MFKNHITLIGALAISLLIFSCKSKNDQSLQGKKSQLKEINASIKKLTMQADSLKVAIQQIEGEKETKKVLITTFETKKETFDSFVELQGKSRAKKNIQMTTDIGGIITKVYVEEGQQVSKGQTMIKIDNAIQASQLVEIETSLNLAEEVYYKRQRLWNKNIGSELEYLQAKNNYDALIDRKKTLITQMGKANLKAPFSGTVDQVFLKVGELASPGLSALNLVNLNEMEVELNIPENYLGSVQKGDIVNAYFPALSREIAAKLKSISQSINTNNRTFKAVATIPNNDGSLKPNLLAKIKINNLSQKNAIAIPANLLQKSAQGLYVYIVDFSDSTKLKAKEIPVLAGASYNGYIVIEEGLKEGDVLIQEGFREVLNGDLVEIAK